MIPAGVLPQIVETPVRGRPTRPPVFSCPQRPDSDRLKIPCPQTAERRQFPRGPAIRFCQPIGGELPWSGTNLIPRPAPSRRPPPSCQPWRATQLSMLSQHHLQYKNEPPHSRSLLSVCPIKECRNLTSGASGFRAECRCAGAAGDPFLHSPMYCLIPKPAYGYICK